MSKRTIDLKDWGHLSHYRRHALFCVSYLLLTSDAGMNKAIKAISRRLRFHGPTLHKIVKQYITIDAPASHRITKPITP